MNKILVTILILVLIPVHILAASAEESAYDAFERGLSLWESGDHGSAIEPWTRAAELGLAEASYGLGVAYSNGLGVERSYETAIEYYIAAAERGLPEAQFNLGVLYRDGLGTDPSDERAVEYFTMAADQGFADAQCSLGTAYITGKGVERSAAKAMEYYRLAAEQGDPVAQCNLGIGYDNGEGVEQSFEKAAEYYRLAADQGYANAQYHLGCLYEFGQGVEQSLEKAAEYYQLAADQGSRDAQYNLGNAYDYGRGVPRSSEKAAEYYRLAADRGHVRAQFNLGVLYRDGAGVEQSFEKAAEYFSLAADQGDNNAQYSLGVLYFNGTGVERSYEKAAECFRTAAAGGNGNALHTLGTMYRDGLGMERSYEKAAECYRQAAEMGSERAQADLKALEREIAVAAGDDPDALMSQAVDSGLEIPRPEAGERLYLGFGDVPDTQRSKLYLAFLLAPNGRSIRWISMLGEGLEVTHEGESPLLVKHSLSTVEDHWYHLDIDGTDILLQKDPPVSIDGLKLGDDGGACRLTLAGLFTDASDGAAGSFHAVADIRLLNMSGDPVIPAIDPPARAQAEAAGLKLPEPGEGEALYIGAANVSQAEALYVAFLLSEDGTTVRGLTVCVVNMDITYRTGNQSVHITSGKYSTFSQNPVPVSSDLAIGGVRLSDLTVTDDAASCVLRFTYTSTDGDVHYPFDAARVTFARAD
ncbi:MAG: SEL1-like repeat protein [Clostridia bacterium]|nr:SEL1-like repeat protein [Clostridia bacterium]